ncbi:hypothetical protein [Paenibacillus massiliensis]|uniref:hypothetical protein n=1 Tax=Paenibacillus massiliensis TaxID=225917 RepID=UPI000403EDAB|nr:hypothetical protein [Paenibacillus massiliensis]
MSDMVIRKTQGEYPLDIVVLDEVVHFDKRGVAEVDEIIGEVLLSIPGYVECEKKTKEPDPPQSEKDKNALDPEKEKKETTKGKQAASPANQTPTPSNPPAAAE